MRTIFAIIIILLSVTSLGCVMMPDRDDYTFQECFLADACHYYSSKSDGKIDCALEAANCRKVRIMARCNDPKFIPDKMSFQSCWDKLD